MKKITIIISALILLIMISSCIQESEDLSIIKQEKIDEVCIDKCGDGICQDDHLGGVYLDEQKPPCRETIESCPQDCKKEQKCSDDTIKNSCSATKPKYCTLDSDGKLILVDSCKLCGCPLNEECQSNGSCAQKYLYEAIEIDDKTGSVDETIEFTITIKETPRNIETFGLSVFFDPNVLEYTGNYEKGLIVREFQFFEVNEEFKGKLNIGGFTTQSIIKKSSSGQLVKLNFKVLKCKESVLEVKNLVDNMDDWYEVEGTFRC